MRTSSCQVCGGLGQTETSYSKYGAPQYDKPLPAAAESLHIVLRLDDTGTDRRHVRRCPDCGALFSYVLTCDYQVNGSEDEETLSRLSAEESAAFIRRCARDLESMRRDIDRLDTDAGSLGDFLDRGHPPPADVERLYDEMQAARAAADHVRQRLADQIDAFRKTCPDVLSVWIDAHVRACRSYLCEDERADDADRSVHFLAGSTEDAWKALLAGGSEFVRVNDVFLPDYAARVDEALG